VERGRRKVPRNSGSNKKRKKSRLDSAISKAVDEGFNILGKTQKEISLNYWTLTTGKKIEEIPQYFEEFLAYLQKTLQSGAMTVADRIKEVLIRDVSKTSHMSESEKKSDLLKVVNFLKDGRH
jgi:hypothetical protein